MDEQKNLFNLRPIKQSEQPGYRHYRETEVRQKMKGLEEKHARTDEQVKDLVLEMKDTKKSLDIDRYKTIEVLAFFVAFFTFVSVEFQFFSRLTNFWELLSLSFILFGFMTFFVILLDRVARKGYFGSRRGGQRKGLWKLFVIFLANSKLLIFTVMCIIGGLGIAGLSLVHENESKAGSSAGSKATICTELRSGLLESLGDKTDKSKYDDQLRIYNDIGC